MALNNPNTEIIGSQLTKEELEVTTHVLHECPYGEPTDNCTLKPLRNGDVKQRAQNLGEMLKTPDRRNRLKIMITYHQQCARKRAEGS